MHLLSRSTRCDMGAAVSDWCIQMPHRSRFDDQRCRVTYDKIDGLSIEIPSIRNWPFALFLSVWLCGWLFGELAALATIASYLLGVPLGPAFSNHPPAPFLIVWILFWTIAGAVIADALVWQLRGQELIQINEERIVMNRVGSLWRRGTRVFRLADLQNLRFAPLVYSMFPRGIGAYRERWEAQMQWLGTSGGSIAFDVEDRTYRFGIQLSEHESWRLIKTIKDHYKIADDKYESLPVERL